MTYGHCKVEVGRSGLADLVATRGAGKRCTRACGVGVVLGTPSGRFDPTTDGPLADANVLMHGSVTRLLTALLLAAAGDAILRTRALPRWAGRTAYLLAAVNLAFVPSLFFGMDPARFYSALGWGNTALTAGLITYWAAAVGIAARRRAPKPVAATAH